MNYSQESFNSIYKALKYYQQVNIAFNSMLGLRAKDEDIISMLDGEMDIAGAFAEKALAKAEGKC